MNAMPPPDQPMPGPPPDWSALPGIPPAPPAARTRPRWLVPLIIGLSAVFGLCCAGGVATVATSGGQPKATAPSAGPQPPTTTSAAVASAVPIATTPATTVPPTTQAPAPVVATPVKYSGVGDKILKITKPAGTTIGFAKATYRGDSNFVIETVETKNLLVNTIGSYSGTVLFDVRDGEETQRLKITADGPWTITLLPIESLRGFDTRIAGHGDEVLVYTGAEGVATIKHTGEANFVVTAYTDSADLLVNTIGNYSGEQMFTGKGLIEVEADGNWSITVAAG